MAREAQVAVLLLNPILNPEPSPPSTPPPQVARERGRQETTGYEPFERERERGKHTLGGRRGGARRPRPLRLSSTLSLKPVIATTIFLSEPYIYYHKDAPQGNRWTHLKVQINRHTSGIDKKKWAHLGAVGWWTAGRREL